MLLRNLRVALFLVSRAIWRGNRGTVLLTMLIITLAFINMSFMASILNGLVATIDQQVIDNYVSSIVAEPTPDDEYITKVGDLIMTAESTPGVVACSPRYSFGATMSYDPQVTGQAVRHVAWPVTSMDPDADREVTRIYQNMVAGEYLDPEDRDYILLGRELSGGYGALIKLQSLDVDIGDKINVQYSNGVSRRYTVKGIYATKFPLTDMGAFVTEKEMEGVLGLHDRASKVLIRTDTNGDQAALIQTLTERGLTNVQLRPWTDYLSFFKGLTDSLMSIVAIVSVIGLVVAGVTIFIVIYINAYTRRRQIGILKAIGMSERIITTSYVFQALFYGFVGIGLGVGVMYFVLLPHFQMSPLDFPIGNVSLVVTNSELITNAVGLVAASLVGGFIPSRRVAKEDIIRAIWG